MAFLLWQHLVEQIISLLLFFEQLLSSIFHDVLQVVSVFLHYCNHVVQNVWPPKPMTKQTAQNENALHILSMLNKAILGTLK